jgi:hypothetical protein
MAVEQVPSRRRDIRVSSPGIAGLPARGRERMPASRVCNHDLETREPVFGQDRAPWLQHYASPKRLTFSVVGFKPAALDRRRDEVEL